MKRVKLDISNRKDIKLSANLELPDTGEAHSYAIFAHCFTCSKNLGAVRAISKAMTKHGFGVLRFDFTGLGNSEGEFADSSFSSNVHDLVDMAQFLTESYSAPKLLIGHSLGGAAVLFASAQLESVTAVATIGAPSAPQHVQHLFGNSIEAIKEDGKAMVNIGGREFPISSEFITDLESKDLPKVLKRVDESLLIMHSPQDNIVSINHASEIYLNARHPKSFISLDGADHLLSTKADAVYAGNIIAQWATRYLGAEIPEL